MKCPTFVGGYKTGHGCPDAHPRLPSQLGVVCHADPPARCLAEEHRGQGTGTRGALVLHEAAINGRGGGRRRARATTRVPRLAHTLMFRRAPPGQIHVCLPNRAERAGSGRGTGRGQAAEIMRFGKWGAEQDADNPRNGKDTLACAQCKEKMHKGEHGRRCSASRP